MTKKKTQETPVVVLTDDLDGKKAEEQPKPAKNPGAGEKAVPVFSRETLRQRCREVFGIQPAFFDGAFRGVTTDMAIAQAKEVVDRFMAQKVGGVK